jgi:hypothetical protein
MTSTDPHNHGDGFDASADPLGRPVNGALLAEFIGAAFDGCTPCQDAQLTLLADDDATTARLVELACVGTAAQFGGLPDNMTVDGYPGPASPEFRRLARAGLDGGNDTMFTTAAQMTSTERRAAANTAADLLVGQLMMGGGPQA